MAGKDGRVLHRVDGARGAGQESLSLSVAVPVCCAIERRLRSLMQGDGRERNKEYIRTRCIYCRCISVPKLKQCHHPAINYMRNHIDPATLFVLVSSILHCTYTRTVCTSDDSAATVGGQARCKETMQGLDVHM